MLQHRAVAHLPNVVEVSLIATRPGPREAHVAEPAGDFGQVLARDLGIRLPGHTVILQEPSQFGIIDDLATQQVDDRLADYANILGRIEGCGHASPFTERGVSRLPQWQYLIMRQNGTLEEPGGNSHR